MTDSQEVEKQQRDKQQLNDLFTQLKSSIDTEKYPQFALYIDGTKDYIDDIFKKMQQSDDKEKTSDDIAKDLTGKINGWLEMKKEELDKEKSQTKDEK